LISNDRGWDEYYLAIARAVGARSNCLRRRVGAIIVVQKAIIATGYKGTPMGVSNCCDGGCPRCASDAPRRGLRHLRLRPCGAERHRARPRHATPHGATLYATLRPCFGCAKESIRRGSARSLPTNPTSTAPAWKKPTAA